MGMKLPVLAVFIGVIAGLSGALSAEDLTVEYLEGWVDVRSGGTWREVSIGDTVGPSAALRLEEDSLIELSRHNAELTLTGPGTYDVAKVLRGYSARERSGYEGLLAEKLRTILRGKRNEGEQTVVGGVRGDTVDDTELGWVEDDGGGYITAGREALGREEYELALQLFREAYDYVYGPEAEREVLFHLALTETFREDRASALSYLQDVSFASGDELYDDYALLKAKLLIDTFDYRGAADFLRGYIESFDAEPPEEAQTAYFLLGIAYNALDDSRASEAFSRAAEIDRTGDIGKAAASFLP